MSLLNDILDDLSACLCAALTPDGAECPDLCFCGVVPGQQVALDLSDNCDSEGTCGMGWVRLDSSYPAGGLAVPWDPTRGGCGVMLGVTVEIGVIRCLEVPANGEPPDAETLAWATHQQIDDMLAIRKAIVCCDADEYALGVYTPHGPAGGIVGGWWTMDLAL